MATATIRPRWVAVWRGGSTCVAVANDAARTVVRVVLVQVGERHREGQRPLIHLAGGGGGCVAGGKHLGGQWERYGQKQTWNQSETSPACPFAEIRFMSSTFERYSNQLFSSMRDSSKIAAEKDVRGEGMHGVLHGWNICSG